MKREKRQRNLVLTILALSILVINMVSIVNAQEIYCKKSIASPLLNEVSDENNNSVIETPIEPPIIIIENPEIEILSPYYYDNFNNNRIRFNVKTVNKCNLEYADKLIDYAQPILCSDYYPEIEFSDKDFKELCKDCYEYNQSRSFKDGVHYLEVRCKDNKEISQSVIFYVDGKTPRITNTKPKDNSFVNGSQFSVKYIEDFVPFAKVSIREVCANPRKCKTTEVLQFCSTEKSNECYFDSAYLKDFEGKEIEYFFTIYNLAGKSAESKKFRGFVDTQSPIIKSFTYKEDKNRVIFNAEIIEPNLDRVEYIDYHDRNSQWRLLCKQLKNNQCISPKPLTKGLHFFDIRAIDKAGNIGQLFIIDAEDDAVLGDPNAKITLIEFGDYKDEDSFLFWNNTLPLIKKQYIDTNKVRFIFRDFPQSENSQYAAESTECIKAKGGDEAFWKMQDKIFENHNNITMENLINWSAELGYNIQDCLDSGDYFNEVEKDVQDAETAGVSKAPTFFINKDDKTVEKLEGNKSFTKFKEIFNKLLPQVIIFKR